MGSAQRTSEFKSSIVRSGAKICVEQVWDYFVSAWRVETLLSASVRAQELKTYDDKLISEMASADSPDTIRVATRINTTNWQQYRKFMTVSQQAFPSGKYFYHMGTGLRH